MRIDGIHIAGIGTARTDLIDTAEAVRQGWYEADERDQSGLLSIAVAGTTPAPDMAVEAAEHAFKQSTHTPEEISALFHTSVHPQGPDGWSAQHYINRKTVNQPVTSVEIRNGCVGFFSSLHLASCYLSAAPARTAALLTCADNFGTPSVNRWRAAPKLFVLADGGGAVVLSKDRGFARLLAIDSISNPELEPQHLGGEKLFPPGITTGGMLNFQERMAHSQQRVAEGLLPPMTDFASVLIDVVEKTLKDAGTSMDEIAKVVHDGFAHGALHDIFLDPLGVTDDRAIWEFTRRLGHAGPLDQIRGLEHVWKTGAAGVGDKVLLVSGSPGMEAACAVLEITQMP
jgi:3-oxoacyl-[acyl-carrier-protein] synthase-3